MKKLTGRRAAVEALLMLSLLLCIPLSVQARAQNDMARAQQSETGREGNDRDFRRGDLPRALNLSSDQIEQIRAIRELHKDEWRAARQLLVQAQRALDEAIYADTVNEAVIEERARDVAAAQAAIIRMRALTELSIRRVLTQEQLDILRNLRKEARAAGRQRRLANSNNQPPMRDRFGRRPNMSIQNDDKGGPGLTPRDRRGGPLRRPRP